MLCNLRIHVRQMPAKIYRRHFRCGVREEKISMPEMQGQKTQAGNIGFSDRNVQKELACTSELALITQIGLFNLLIREQSGGGVGQGNLSGFNDIAAMGKLQGKLGVLFDQQYGGACPVPRFFHQFQRGYASRTHGMCGR